MELEARILERVRIRDAIPLALQELGKDLRHRGPSYGEIMELVPVKKSTLATWCRDILLTDEQIGRIALRRTPAPGRNLAGER